MCVYVCVFVPPLGWILLTEEILFISSLLCVLALELDTNPPQHSDCSVSVIRALQSGCLITHFTKITILFPEATDRKS